MGSIDGVARHRIRLRDQAVLCRTNARLNEIAQGLENRGIPVLHLGSLFERDEVRDLLAVLAFIGDSSGDALVRLAAMERYSIRLQDVYRVLRHFRESGDRAHWDLSTAIDGVSAEGSIALARLWEDIGAFSANMNPWDIALTYLLDKTDDVRVAGELGALLDKEFLAQDLPKSPPKVETTSELISEVV